MIVDPYSYYMLGTILHMIAHNMMLSSFIHTRVLTTMMISIAFVVLGLQVVLSMINTSTRPYSSIEHHVLSYGHTSLGLCCCSAWTQSCRAAIKLIDLSVLDMFLMSNSSIINYFTYSLVVLVHHSQWNSSCTIHVSIIRPSPSASTTITLHHKKGTFLQALPSLILGYALFFRF